jgi:uncharacterized LabA/DUF88 family protein
LRQAARPPTGGLSFTGEGGVQTAYVYIDGFNLYNGCIKGSDCKWLDLRKLCELYLPEYRVGQVRYYTAYITPRHDDPYQIERQRVYIRALRTIPNLSIHFGRFFPKKKDMYLARSKPGKPEFATVIRNEEKGSDVNLATHLLHDGIRDLYDVAVVVSNDSDLLEPIKVLREHYDLTVGLLNPHKKPSKHLRKNTDFIKQIRRGPLRACQLPPTLTDAKGTITKPSSW